MIRTLPAWQESQLLSGPFTIPSGIVTTATPIIQYIFDHMPEVGVVTTKSIGLEGRAGYREPVLSQYAPGCFVNAVGLTNPGAERSRELLGSLRVPADTMQGEVTVEAAD